MSTFKVSVETIEKAWTHPNADKLDLASVEGMMYQFVVGRNQFTAGSKVIYFPIDSLLPEQLIKDLEMEGKFSGHQKNRIKTIKLRKEISQGFVVGLNDSKIASYLVGLKLDKLESGYDLTKNFNVEKYEHEIHGANAGKNKASRKGPKHLTSHPVGISTYDIEGVKRNKKVVDYLMDKRVYVCEKVEGTNWYLSSESDGKLIHGQRNFAIKDWDDRTKWEKVVDWFKYKNPFRKGKPYISPSLVDSDYGHKATSVKLGLPEKLVAMKAKHFAPIDQVVFRGELIGPSIQDNIYHMTEQKILLFDIQVNGRYVNPDMFVALTKEFNIATVPVIVYDVTLQNWLGTYDVIAAANGTSKLYNTLREGIVIKPMVEEYSKELGGRLIIKHRDDEYLEKTGL
jgi:hypothetical protein